MRIYENSKENCIVDDWPSSGIYLLRQCFEVLTETSPGQVRWSAVPVAAASLPLVQIVDCSPHASAKNPK